jgi:hypothetical protein
MIRKSIIAAVAFLTIASYANATLIAEWTFESAVPTTPGTSPGNFGAEGGVNAGASSLATGLHASAASVWSTPVGNGSAKSLSGDHWAVGDYYQFCTSTSGYSSIVVVDQTGSNTGPRFHLKSAPTVIQQRFFVHCLFNGAKYGLGSGTTAAQQRLGDVLAIPPDNLARLLPSD